MNVVWSCTDVMWSCTDVMWSCMDVMWSCMAVMWSCTGVMWSCTGVMWSCTDVVIMHGCHVILQVRKGRHRTAKRVDDVEKMRVLCVYACIWACNACECCVYVWTMHFQTKCYSLQERASHIKTFIYVKIPQTSLCITYKVRKEAYTMYM